VVFSKTLNTNTLFATNFVVTCNGTNPFTPTLTYSVSNIFVLGNLAAYTQPLGTYQVSLNLAGVQDLAGNTNTNVLTMTWVRGTTNQPPVLTLITNLVVPPDGMAAQRVLATDANGDALSYSLAPGADSRAALTVTKGKYTFRWAPTRDMADTTNYFTVVVTDNGYPVMSATQTFAVVVLDYLELSFGTTNLEGGQSASVPVYLASNAGVTNLLMSVPTPDGALTNWTLQTIAPQIATSSLTDQLTNLVIALATANGQSLTATQQILTLHFSAKTNSLSAFIPVSTINPTGGKPSGGNYHNYVVNPGEITVVQDTPLIRALVANGQRDLNLYGKLGTNYQVLFNTNLFNPSWYPLLNYTQTNGVITLPIDAANPNIYYRILQQ